MKAPARAHPLWLAFMLHMLSGLALALFYRRISGYYRWHSRSRSGWIIFAVCRKSNRKIAEFGLVLLLSVHIFGGLRLLALEFMPWSHSQKTLAAGAVGLSLFISTIFLLQAL